MYKLYRQKIKGGIAVEEIKVGEYVRTKKGLIGKVNKIELEGNGVRYGGEFLTDTIIQFNDGRVYERRVRDKEILKHSFNIIDLIEAEDYINGNRVYKVTSNCIYCIGKAIQNKSNINIKTILTKEQNERNCYRLEDN